jgi:hypothetical protein
VASEDAPVRPEDLVTFGEVRAALGVTKQRAAVITRDHRFPPPWYVSADGTVRLWRRADVEAWLDVNRPGWRESD